jgi:prepilin-type N-terminal cleavage/methylation domain-containing protein/prepilin-type processing-associated H-X9-DG protein
MPPKRPVSPKGFTLVELLVVVAVIGVLASMLMPSILSGMKSATATSCRNNLLQIHHALMMYIKDHSLIPAAGYGPVWGTWYEKVELTIGTREICRCPGKKNAEIGYGLNYRFLAGVNPPWLWYNMMPIDVVQRPSGTILIGDTAYVSNPTAAPRDWIENPASVSGGYIRFPQEEAPIGNSNYPWWGSDPWRPVPRHPQKRANCLFFDGHTEPISIDALVNYNFGDPECLYDNK